MRTPCALKQERMRNSTQPAEPAKKKTDPNISFTPSKSLETKTKYITTSATTPLSRPLFLPPHNHPHACQCRLQPLIHVLPVLRPPGDQRKEERTEAASHRYFGEFPQREAKQKLRTRP